MEESGTCLCLCSAQNVKVMKSQTSVGKRPSRLSQGSQVSMQCSECESCWKFKQTRVNGGSIHDVGWLVRQKFVILVPDPIGVSPSWSLRGGTRVSSGLIARQLEELEDSFAAGPALQLSLFQDTSDWPFCAFVQCRRRPEKWTRTGKWDSRGSVTVDFLCVCTLSGLHFLSQDGGGG